MGNKEGQGGGGEKQRRKTQTVTKEMRGRPFQSSMVSVFAYSSAAVRFFFYFFSPSLYRSSSWVIKIGCGGAAMASSLSASLSWVQVAFFVCLFVSAFSLLYLLLKEHYVDHQKKSKL
jgi:hypothetical protein